DGLAGVGPVALAARADELEDEPLGLPLDGARRDRDGGGAERRVHAGRPHAEVLRHRLGQRDAAAGAYRHEVEVGRRPPEERVAHGPADDVGRQPQPVGRGADAPEDALVREGEVRHGEGEMATGQWLLAHYRKRSITRSTRRGVWAASRMETGAGRLAATAAGKAASSSPGGGVGPNARAGAGFAGSV